jgi:hypothetical protein
MPHNIVRIAKVPFTNGHVSPTQKRMIGKGNGSILLKKGGAGAASSYMDMDDYIRTTGNNPLARSTGSGLKTLSDKLAKLSLEAKPLVKGKIKNIVMSM